MSKDEKQVPVVGFNVTTEYNKDIIISEVQDINTRGFQPLVTKIIKLQDEGVRAALIELGWTPPKDSCEHCIAYCEWEKIIDDLDYTTYYESGCDKKPWITDTDKGKTPLNDTYKFCPSCGKPVIEKINYEE